MVFYITALDLLKTQLRSSRHMFEGTVADVTEEMMHKTPGGKALPLGATYAHQVFSEDAIVNGMIQGKQPLFLSDWKDKTGASEPMPHMDDKWSENNEKWAHSVQFNLPQIKEYAKAVFDTTQFYVDGLTDADLEQEIDLGSWGKQSVATLLSDYVIGHRNAITGEMSALKGIQGAKGYPF